MHCRFLFCNRFTSCCQLAVIACVLCVHGHVDFLFQRLMNACGKQIKFPRFCYLRECLKQNFHGKVCFGTRSDDTEFPFLSPVELRTPGSDSEFLFLLDEKSLLY